MGYPSGWGQDKLGADIQKYVAGKTSWDDMIDTAKKTWADKRK